MKKFHRVFFIFLNFCFFLTGCKDFKDLDRRLFVVAIGIDVSPDDRSEMQVIFKAAVTKMGNGTAQGGQVENNSEIYTVSGKSIVDIFREVKAKTYSEPDYSHMKLLLFGSEFIKNNSIDKIIDFFVRRRDFQDIANVATAMPSAKDILSVDLEQENFPGNGLFMKFGQGTESPYALKRRLYVLFHQIITPGISPTLPVIELKDDKFVMEKIHILSDGKLKLELTREDSKFFNMLIRNVPLASLSTQVDNEELGIGLSDVKSTIKYTGKGKNLSYNIQLKANGTLERPGEKWKTMDEFSNIFSKLACKRVRELLDKFKNNNVDPLELEIKYWSSTRDFWFKESWLEEEFSRAAFNISCDIRMVGTGTLR